MEESLKEQQNEEPIMEASLMTLPPEVIQTLLRKVSEDDLLSLRLVAHYLKANIDEGHGIPANFGNDLTQEQIHFYGKTVIREACMGDMTYMKFPELFCKPLNLETVAFCDKIPTTFFKDLLISCTKLKSLYVYGQIDGLLDMSNIKNKIGLLDLRNLDIRMAKEGSEMQAYQCTENTLSILDDVFAPSLISLCIEVWIVGPGDIKQVTACVMDFLARHNKLKKLFLCSRQYRMRIENHGDGPIEELYFHTSHELSTKDLAKQMKALSKKVQLRTMLINVSSEDDLWFIFLSGQKKMEKIGLCDTVGTSNWIALTTIPIKQNWATLKTLYILANFQFEYFDFSCLRECTSLRDLLLINSIESVDENFPSGHFINFTIAESCPNLEFLAISYISIAREHLQQIVQLKALKYLGLIMTGGALGDIDIGVGVNLQLIKDFLHMRSLEGLLINGVRVNTEDVYEKLEFDEMVRLLKMTEDEEEEYSLINIRDLENEDNRRWTCAYADGFVFDIDFFTDN